MNISKDTVVVNRRNSPFDVYIGRGSPLGNPYSIGEYGDRNEVVRKYAYDFPLRYRTEPKFKAAVLGCKGKRLGCYCKPELCHGDVIVHFLRLCELYSEQTALVEIQRWTGSHEKAAPIAR